MGYRDEVTVAAWAISHEDRAVSLSLVEGAGYVCITKDALKRSLKVLVERKKEMRVAYRYESKVSHVVD